MNDTDFRSSAASPKSEKAAVLAELDKLLEDDLFRRSHRYSALLRYIVEKVLDSQTSDLKERTIGINVFHRAPDYDTNDDPVVRFCAGEIRKRLAQYYRSHPGSPVEIGLNLGSYVPVFRHRLAVADYLLPSTETPARSAEAPQPLASKSFRSSHRALSFTSAALLLSFAVAAFIRFEGKPDPIKGVWAPLLNHAVKVDICTGTPPPDSTPSVETPNISIEDHFRNSGHRVSLPTASAIATISGFLESRNQQYGLSEAESTAIDNLRTRPFVLVNANNNKWTLLLLRSTRFHFETTGSVASIVDAENPAQHDWRVDFSKPYTQQSTDYAIVARLLNGAGGSPAIIVAGISSNGTEAAGAFSVSPTSLAELARHAPRGWENMNFEAVLKVQVVQGHVGAVQIAATHFWPRSTEPDPLRMAGNTTAK